MKLLVISDTHGNYPASIKAADTIEAVDRIIHLGDFCDDASPLATALGREIIRVAGNCDYDSPLPREIVGTFEGVTLLICHGDRYGVKGGFGRIIGRARQAGARAVLFGHTHHACVHEQEGILLINPGSLQKGTETPSVALVAISSGTISAQIRYLPAEDNQ